MRKFVSTLVFIIVFSFLSFVLISAYKEFSEDTKKYSMLNPLGLEIKNAIVTENEIVLYVYNPNNESVSIIPTMVSISNSFGSVGFISMGGDIGVVKTIPPLEIREYKFYTLNGIKAKEVIIQWLASKTNLTIRMYYEDIKSGKTGIIQIKIIK